MRAIVQHRYGDAPEDVLRSDEAARPTIGPDEVLVQVHAASVDRGTWHVKARRAHVTAVVSTGKIDLVRKLGADEVVDYTHEDITGRYDAILDIGGNRPLSRLRRALTPRGRLVIVGGETGGRWLGGTDRQLRAQALN